jgi:DNA polymerase-1
MGLLQESIEDKAILAFKAVEYLTGELKANNLWKFYKEIEEPLIPVLFSMEKNGILFDLELLKRLQDSIGIEIKDIEQKIYELAGTEFNLRSPKQLGKILFDKLDRF